MRAGYASLFDAFAREIPPNLLIASLTRIPASPALSPMVSIKSRANDNALFFAISHRKSLQRAHSTQHLKNFYTNIYFLPETITKGRTPQAMRS